MTFFKKNKKKSRVIVMDYYYYYCFLRIILREEGFIKLSEFVRVESFFQSPGLYFLEESLMTSK